jgi:ABC-2 type transport system ATP-binding protein
VIHHEIKPVVEACGLTVIFRRAKEEVQALRGVTFSLGPGEGLALLGGNGAGKSTLIKVLAGILLPREGEVRLWGLDPWRFRTRLAQRYGLVLGGRSRLSPLLSVEENLKLWGALYGLVGAHAKRRIQEVAEALDLNPILGVAASRLSLGQRNRAELALALLPEPELLLLDEPFIGLDALGRKSVLNLLETLKAHRGVTLILASHELSGVEGVLERALVLRRGEVAFLGDLSAFRTGLDFRRVKVIFHEPFQGNPPPGATVSEGGYVLEAKVSPEEIPGFLSRMLAFGRVREVSVQEPSLEEVMEVWLRT